MITIPQTAITEESFERWRSFKIKNKDENGSDYWYYIIPLVDVDKDKFLQTDDYYPHLFSSENGEFEDDMGNQVFSVFLFEDDLPALTTEEEVEILYKIVTKRDIWI